MGKLFYRRNPPLSAAQTRRRYAVRFWIAAVSCTLYAYAAWVLANAAIAIYSVLGGVVAMLVAGGAVMFGRSARRRWKRWREFEEWV